MDRMTVFENDYKLFEVEVQYINKKISMIVHRVCSTSFERFKKSCSYNLSCFTPKLEGFIA